MLDIGARLGPYEIVSFIGAGGMGEVYRARDSRLERDVAVKVLSNAQAGNVDAVGRFEREAKAIAALSHPNIVSIFDVGTTGGVVFAVTEMLEGETLHAQLQRGRMSWRQACEVGMAVAEGLAAAHGRGIVHRDLKPDNIFLGRDGRVKILDFGLACTVEPAGLDDAVTMRHTTTPGQVVGTVGYMAPEQVRGEVAGPTSDIFSLGCVLYEMLTGDRPFARRTPIEVLAAILEHPPKPLSGSGALIPQELEQLVFHCLVKEPRERFQSARDVALTLHSLHESADPELRSSTRFASGVVMPSFEPPVTQYARSGDVNIAYQVTGEGPLDLVFVMGWITHLPFVGDQDAITDEVEEFLTGVRHTVEPDRVLATILHLRSADGDSFETHRTLIERELEWFRGKAIRLSSGVVEAAFDGPARAVRCADAIRKVLLRPSVPVMGGLHTGECDRVGETASGLPLQIAAAIASTAPSGTILVSSTVRDLVAGSGLTFIESGIASLGASGEWRLFRVA